MVGTEKKVRNQALKGAIGVTEDYGRSSSSVLIVIGSELDNSGIESCED